MILRGATADGSFRLTLRLTLPLSFFSVMPFFVNWSDFQQYWILTCFIVNVFFVYILLSGILETWVCFCLFDCIFSKVWWVTLLFICIFFYNQKDFHFLAAAKTFFSFVCSLQSIYFFFFFFCTFYFILKDTGKLFSLLVLRIFTFL